MNIGPFFLPSFSLLPTNTWIYSSQTKAQRWQLSRVIFTACLPFLIHCSAVPRLL
jgi:hypothetical protein